MTYTDPTSPPAASHAAAWELCDHCQAPLAERQRYCVVCGARRAQVDDPAARWFVEQARRARAAETAPSGSHASAGGGDAAARLRFALVFALLPIVAALGIMVGRGSDGDRLVDALKAQKAPVVNVMGGGTASSDVSGGGSDSGSGDSQGDDSDPAKGDVIAETRYGSARSLTNSRVTPQQIEESRRALRHIVESKGRAYVEQQRNLPDQIVIP